MASFRFPSYGSFGYWLVGTGLYLGKFSLDAFFKIIPARLAVEYAQNDFTIPTEGRDIYIDIDEETTVLINFKLKSRTKTTALTLINLGFWFMAYSAYERLNRAKKTAQMLVSAEAGAARSIATIAEENRLKQKAVQSVVDAQVEIKKAEEMLKVLDNLGDTSDFNAAWSKSNLAQTPDELRAFLVKNIENNKAVISIIEKESGRMAAMAEEGITTAGIATDKAKKAKKARRIARLAKMLGADFLIFLGTLILDVAVINDEQERAILNGIDAFAAQFGVEDFTDTYNISLPTSPSDIIISMLIKEGFDLILDEDLSVNDQITLFFAAFASEAYEITVKAVFSPINIDLDADDVRKIVAGMMLQKVGADPYLLLEGFLIAFALKSIYAIYWKGAGEQLLP